MSRDKAGTERLAGVWDYERDQERVGTRRPRGGLEIARKLPVNLRDLSCYGALGNSTDGAADPGRGEAGAVVRAVQ